jgi:hypothetical protein
MRRATFECVAREVKKNLARTILREREENRARLCSQLASERAHFLPVRPPQVNFTLLKLNNPVTFSFIVSMGGPKNADHWGPAGQNQFCACRVSLKIPNPRGGIPFLGFDYFLFRNLSSQS